MDSLVTPRGVTAAVAVVAIVVAACVALRRKSTPPAPQHRKEPRSQFELVSLMTWRKHLTHPAAIEAFAAVDRAHYVDHVLGTEALGSDFNSYADQALPLAFNATISAPHMHAIGLDLLAEVITPGSVVLDVGSGSGFVTACLAHLVGPEGKVYGVEHIAELAEQGRKNVEGGNPALLPRTHFTVGDGLEGLEDKGPFTAIYVGAAAASIEEAQRLVDQLLGGGRMVIPVGSREGFHQLLQVDVAADGSVKVKSHGTVRFVPLTSKRNQMEADVTSGISQPVQLPSGQRALVKTFIVPAPDTSIEGYRILRSNLQQMRKEGQDASKKTL